jgi:hypothetical protein
MMEIPSIFIPEDWSFTFYEGLNRHPDSIFRDKTVAELGCGNGWISIALAEKWCPSKVGTSCSATKVETPAVIHLLRLHDIELLGVCQSADGLTCFVYLKKNLESIFCF